MNEMIKILYLFGLVLLLIIISSSVIGSIYSIDEGNVALININAEISTSSSVLSQSISSDSLIASLSEAENNPNVEAIILSINSPGGTVVASKEVAKYIKTLNKTTIAWIRDMGASGAYLIASACNYIISDELSMVGNVGAKMSYLSFNGTLEKYGAKYYEISSGAMKEIGSEYKDLTKAEYDILYSIVNESFNYLLDFVTINRNLDSESIEIIKDGRVFSGSQALAVGLIDKLGSKKEIIEYLESINITDVKIYEISSSNDFDILNLLNYKSNLVYPTYD
ncbi:MAG: signal peptide peptidase SppA [Candidatus Nanoarchaeia archaeon]|nr:signal peptide peptidase SppA [Candidatus Nanoarchaeia archaeon]